MLEINQLSSSKICRGMVSNPARLKKPVPRCFRWVTGYETSFFKCDREISEDVRPHSTENIEEPEFFIGLPTFIHIQTP